MHAHPRRIHLTLTGLGTASERMLCLGTPGPQDCFVHAMYCTEAQLAEPRICPACKTLWKAEDASA